MAMPVLDEAPNHGVIRSWWDVISIITTTRLQARGLLRDNREVSSHAPSLWALGELQATQCHYVYIRYLLKVISFSFPDLPAPIPIPFGSVIIPSSPIWAAHSPIHPTDCQLRG